MRAAPPAQKPLARPFITPTWHDLGLDGGREGRFKRAGARGPNGRRNSPDSKTGKAIQQPGWCQEPCQL